jgi:hypothetical protein
MDVHVGGRLPEHVALRFEGLIEVLQRAVDPHLDLIDMIYFGTETHRPAAGSLHHSVARMAQDCPVVTTNFDVLIEESAKTLPGWSTRSGVIWGQNDWSKARPGPGLWKIHGTARVFQQDRWVRDASAEPAATLRHIARTRRDTSRQEFMKALLADHALIVVGYSGVDDFDISDWLRRFPCPQGLYWISYDGRAEAGLTNLLNERNAALGPVYVLNCESASPAQRGAMVDAALALAANLVDPDGRSAARAAGPAPSSWKIALEEWTKRQLPSKWERDIARAELLKHVSRFRDAIDILNGVEKEVEGDPHRLAKTHLLLSEAETETGETVMRERALRHAELSLDHYGDCRQCNPSDKHAARIAQGHALRLAARADPEGAARIFRELLEDRTLGDVERARVVFELDRLRRVGGTPFMADLATAKEGDIYVEASFLHEENKKAWPVTATAEDLERDCGRMERVEALRTQLGDIRGLCATTNVLGQMYQALADWRGSTDSRYAGIRDRAKIKHSLSRDLAEKRGLFFDVHSAHVSLAIFHLRHSDSTDCLGRAAHSLDDARRYIGNVQDYERLRFEHIEAVLSVALQSDIANATAESSKSFAALATKWPATNRPDQRLGLLKAEFNVGLPGWRSLAEFNDEAEEKFRELLKIPYWRYMCATAIAQQSSVTTALEWSRLLLHPFR